VSLSRESWVVAGSYHTTVMLNDGREVGLRWLTAEDRPLLEELAAALPAEDLRHLNQDLRQGEVLQQWLEGLAAGSMRLLGAQDPAEGGRLAGYCSLQPGRGAHAHLGELEVVLHPAYRDLGLGSNLVREVAGAAGEAGLMFLKAEVPVEELGLITAFQRLGFELKAIMENYRVDLAGEPYHAIIMLKRLRYQSHKEFLYRF